MYVFTQAGYGWVNLCVQSWVLWQISRLACWWWVTGYRFYSLSLGNHRRSDPGSRVEGSRVICSISRDTSTYRCPHVCCAPKRFPIVPRISGDYGSRRLWIIQCWYEILPHAPTMGQIIPKLTDDGSELRIYPLFQPTPSFSDMEEYFKAYVPAFAAKVSWYCA